ncbi:MAG: Uma2 family endonuclease [Gemmatimonadota bacterium]
MDATDKRGVQAGLLTIEEFERLSDDGWRRELVRGQVIKEPPAGFRHGGTAGRIAGILHSFVSEYDLGEVVTAETGFVLFDEPPTVRAPNVAFVARDRLTFDPDRFAPLAPDLAVEIVSPSNTMSEVHAKVVDYLDAGTPLVWVVEPRSRSVTVYRLRREIRLLTGDEEIDVGAILPGLRLKASDLFGR